MKTFIEKMFTEIIENLNADEAKISQYFSPQYIQHVDGHTLDYQGFVQHMAKQKTLLRSAKIIIDQCITQNDSICTVHRCLATKIDGSELEVKVIAFFKVKDGKITYCDELTKLIHGNKTDANIGSC